MRRSELQAIRYVLALLWVASGVVSLGLYPVEDSLEMLRPLGLPQFWSLSLLYGAVALDMAFGILTLTWRRRWLWLGQVVLILSYTVMASVLVPEYWFHPFTPLLKNLPILVLLYLLYQYDQPQRVFAS